MGHPTFSDFKDAEPALQAAFFALKEREVGDQHICPVVAPIFGSDVYYTDGDAAKYIGKILLIRGELAIGCYFFDTTGPCDKPFPPKYDATFRAWIAGVIAKEC